MTRWTSLVKKYRIWVVLAAFIIVVIIVSRLMYWLGSISFIWVMLWLTIALGILAAYIYPFINTKSPIKSLLATLLFCLLVGGIIVTGVFSYFSAPDLSTSDVKTVISQRLNGKAASAEYRGDGIWRVKFISGGWVRYLDYNENTSQIINIVK